MLTLLPWPDKKTNLRAVGNKSFFSFTDKNKAQFTSLLHVPQLPWGTFLQAFYLMWLNKFKNYLSSSVIAPNNIWSALPQSLGLLYSRMVRKLSWTCDQKVESCGEVKRFISECCKACTVKILFIFKLIKCLFETLCTSLWNEAAARSITVLVFCEFWAGL